MRYQDTEFVSSYSAPGNKIENWNLFFARVPEEEFDLDEAVKANNHWANPRGADGVKVLRTYVIGRFEDRTLYAVITTPTYRYPGQLLPADEYFPLVNGEVK